MKRSIILLVTALAMGAFALHSFAQVPSLEGQITLPTIVNGSASVASDGYGQHFVKVDPSDNLIKHYLVGSDGIELSQYRGTLPAASFPVINAYAGKLRTTFKIGTVLYIYQSTDGGINWSQVNFYNFPSGSIYNIDAYTDFYGTHIVWQDRDDFTSEPEVYYVRWDDQNTQWRDYKNVSDLASIPGQWGAKPKVVTSASEAHVIYPYNGNSNLVSRDLNLTNSQWDGSYATSTQPGISLSTAVIGNTVYAIINGTTIAQQSPAIPNREIYFAYRGVNDVNWTDFGYMAGSHINIGFNSKNLIAAGPANDRRLYFINSCYADGMFDCNSEEYGVVLYRYTPGIGWDQTEQVGETSNNDFPILSESQFGVYGFWGDAQTEPLTAMYMRRKPFAITGTIAERTLLTGNNWVSGQAATIDYTPVVDALPNSITNVLSGSWLTVNGTLNASASSQFLFGQNGRLIVYGYLNTNGTASSPVIFSRISGGPGWTGITIATNVRLNQLNYCSISDASIGISASYSKLNIDHSTISNCATGLSLYGMTGVKWYCNLTNSTLNGNGFGVRIESSDRVVFTSNQFNGNVGTGVVVALGSSPRLYFNEFNSNSYGVSVFDQSSPRFGDYIVGDKGATRCITTASRHSLCAARIPSLAWSRTKVSWLV